MLSACCYWWWTMLLWICHFKGPLIILISVPIFQEKENPTGYSLRSYFVSLLSSWLCVGWWADWSADCLDVADLHDQADTADIGYNADSIVDALILMLMANWLVCPPLPLLRAKQSNSSLSPKMKTYPMDHMLQMAIIINGPIGSAWMMTFSFSFR